ncbi:Ig-like domain-containing protein, partial [Planctomycetaceae bacterium]|nr:Ig-like domain-containing protein [Planctomycetaceae bacterium]
MKLVSWLNSIRRSLVPNRRRAACSPIGRIEKLEDRTLLSSTPVSRLLAEIRTGSSAYPEHFTESNGEVFFAANDGVHGTELWKTNGTPEGTQLVKDIHPGSSGSSPYHFADVNGVLYFSATNGTSGHELWRSDGTTDGTTLVTDIRSGSIGSSPQYLTDLNGTLLFSATDGTSGVELWSVIGPTSSASRVKDINPGSGQSDPRYLVALDGQVYFSADNGTSGHELWRSDGTSGGTVLVKDIGSGSTSSSPNYLTVLGTSLFFSASHGSYGSELWKSDGTSGGTSIVSDIRPGTQGSAPTYLTAVGDTLFFSAYGSSTYSTELWKSDGTDTSMVRDIHVGTGGSGPTWLTASDETLYFKAYDGSNILLYKSDGTWNGTVSVHPSFRPDTILAFDNGVLFREYDNGKLYYTDGTASGTLVTGAISVQSSEYSPVAIGKNAYLSGGGEQLYIIGRTDYGDAPDWYPTKYADGGASHDVSSDLHLGAAVDDEYEAWASDGGNGDGADDDGVTFLAPLNPGDTATVRVNASEAGLLDAWLDYNSDGDWNDFGEQLFASQVLSAGDNTLSFEVVPWAIPSDPSFARFRISAAGGLNPTGHAPDGEVEDHPVAINSPPHAATDRYEYVLPSLAFTTTAGTGMLGNDWDPEGHDMDVTDILRDPVHGELSWSADGSFTYTYPGGAGDTNDSWVYEVTDEDGGIDTGTATIYVGPVNEFPTLDAITDPANVDDDAAEQTVGLTGITAGTGESQTLRVTAVSDNTDVLANPTVTYSSADTTGSLAYTPIDNEFGQATVTVTVTDAGHNGTFDDFDDASVIRTFTVTVANAPTLAAINDPTAIDEDAGLQTVNLTGISPGDGETGPVSVAVISDNTGLIPNPAINHSSGNSTGSLTYTPVGDASGSALVTVSVRNEGQDGQLGTDDDGLVEQSFTVNVNAVNDVPTLDATADPGAIDEDSAQQTINLTGITAGGGENQVLSVTAVSSNHSLLADPTVTYTSADSTATLAYTPLADQFGTADITVTVRDVGLDAVAGNGDDGVTTDTFSVDVTSVNELPTLDAISDVVLAEGTEVYSVDLTGISAGGGESQVLTVTAVSSNIARIPHPSV